MAQRLGKALLACKDDEIAQLREEVESLKEQLRANGIEPNKKAAEKELAPALRAFTPLSEEPSLASPLSALAAVGNAVDEAADSGDAARIDAAIEQLVPIAARALAAYHEVIETRCAQSDCITRCLEALLVSGLSELELSEQVVDTLGASGISPCGGVDAVVGTALERPPQ